MADNDNKNGRRRISHYVPDALADQFNERAAKHPALTKQGFFGVVLLAGMRALEDDASNYWHPALQEFVLMVPEQEGEQDAKT